jgi:hypothetical protein
MSDTRINVSKAMISDGAPFYVGDDVGIVVISSYSPS